MTDFFASELDTMIHPLSGLFGQVNQLPVYPGDPRFCIMRSALDDISQVFSTVKGSASKATVPILLDGAGSGIDEQMVKLKAFAEGLERYSCCAYDESQFIWASAEELGATALDLDSIPRCSERELAHARCPLLAPDKKTPLRWVKGISLFDGKPVWLPAVMVYMYISARSSAERFWFPISTGCATHRSFEEALLGALCEVIERDAISLVWLQKMQIPRLEIDIVPPRLQGVFDKQARKFSQIETLFFDATTDIGIPTIYSLQRSHYNEAVTSIVMCSTGLDPVQCVARVTEETNASRIVLQSGGKTNEKALDDFLDVVDGAHYMARREHLEAFDFLTQTPASRRLSEMPLLTTGDPVQDLSLVVNRLRELHMHAYAVDITTDEAMRVGMRVVRVIVPELQPLSFSYRARFLAHPRLYTAPQRMGLPVYNEEELNTWPQPFA